MPVLNRRKPRPADEQLPAVRNSLGRWLPSHDMAALDFGRLDDGDLADLVDLHRKLRDEARQRGAESGGDDPRYLGTRDRKRFKRLVARACGHDDEHFERAEADAETKAKLRELSIRVNRPPARARLEERGAVVLRREWVFEMLRDGYLWIEHLGLLVYVLAMLENGEPLTRRVRIEGDALVIDDANLGLLPSDRTDHVWAWKPILDHLDANGLLAIEKNGRQWRVRRGPRVLEMLEGRRAA
jgi:hypothetical protein